MKLVVTLREKFRKHPAGSTVTISEPQSDDVDRHTTVKCVFTDGDIRYLRISAFCEEEAIIMSFEEEIPLREAQQQISEKRSTILASKGKPFTETRVAAQL